MKTLSTLLVLSFASIAVAQPAPPKTDPAPAAPARIMPAPPPPSAGACFELSPNGKLWSKTPERLCVGAGDKNVEIKLETGMPTATQVAVFHFDLTKRVRCIDCNKDVFALSNPSNSVFNALKISFNGKRDLKAGTETGTLSIGKNRFHYRKVK